MPYILSKFIGSTSGRLHRPYTSTHSNPSVHLIESGDHKRHRSNPKRPKRSSNRRRRRDHVGRPNPSQPQSSQDPIELEQGQDHSRPSRPHSQAVIGESA